MRKLWVLLLLSFPGLASGASFNCAKTTTPPERAICGSPALSKADDQLAAAYGRLVGSSPGDLAAEIRQDQRDWLKWLSAWCGYATKMSGQAWADCMLDPYQQRVERLKKASLRVGGVEFVERAITRYRLDDSETFDSRDWKFNFATLTASWPVARNDAPEWKAWNDAVEKAARGMQENDHAPPGQVPAWEAPEGADSWHRFSISGMGTAPTRTRFRPSSTGCSNDRRELKAEDVFRPESDWDGFLYKRCDEDLHGKLDSINTDDYTTFSPPGEMAKTVHGIVADPVNWVISKDGIAIVYQDYAVACHACRPGPTEISWHDLAPYLQPGFEIPR